MRQFAVVLVLLLTASAARAGITGDQLFFNPLTCCSALLLIFVLPLIVAMAIYDWRKHRRATPPTEDK